MHSNLGSLLPCGPRVVLILFSLLSIRILLQLSPSFRASLGLNRGWGAAGPPGGRGSREGGRAPALALPSPEPRYKGLQLVAEVRWGSLRSSLHLLGKAPSSGVSA